MKGTLILTILSVRSSYLQVLEEPRNNDTETPDTAQWWISDAGSWRIRTYAIDHDIHMYSVRNVANLKEIALENQQKHFGDIVRAQYVIEISDCLDIAKTSTAFRMAGLEPRVELMAGKCLYWKPDEAEYYTQSKPE